MNCSQIISCKNISKSFGGLNALRNVSIDIKPGESVSVVGANGAGKSTLFNIILGLLKPDSGSCEILGVQSEKITASTRGNIGFVADHASCIPWASALDLAKLYSSIYHRWNQKRFLNNTKLWQIDIYRRLNQLSKGQKRLAEIALITATEPKILILDEPFNGLDSVMRITIQRFLKNLQKQIELSIVYATHIISELPTIADRIVILRLGEKVFDQKLKEMTCTPEEIFMQSYSNELNGNLE